MWENPTLEAEFLRSLGTSYRAIYACSLAIVGNASDADDIVQDVCLILWQKYHEFDPATNFRKWACTVAFQVAKNFVRKQRRRKSFGFSDEVLSRLEQVRSGASELFELRRDFLGGCLAKLSAQERQFLDQCYRSETSLVAKAQAQGASVETVYSRLKRLRRKLAECIDKTIERSL